MAPSLESVKQEIRSVLLTYKEGAPLSQFLGTYRSLLGPRLPSRDFGFTQDIDFLYSLSDVVHIELDKNGTYHLHALADKETEHIKKMVNKQRSAKGKTNTSSRGPNVRRRFTQSSSSSSHKNDQRSSTSTLHGRPFVPASIRAEIIQVVKLFPNDGITYGRFHMAYQNLFKRAPDFVWLSTDQQEQFEKLSYVIPELELKIVNGQNKLFFVSQNSPNGNISSGKSQDSNSIMDVSPIPPFVKYNIEKVLKKYPEGISAVHFPILYENFTKKKFDLHDLGYTSLFHLVDALPEVFVRVESPDNANDWKLFHTDFSDNIKDARQASAEIQCVSLQNNSRLFYSREGTMPLGISPPSKEFIPPKLPSNSTDRFFPVFISSFVNPDLFWFQLLTEVKAMYDTLDQDIQNFYNTQDCDAYRMNDADILIGSSCVAFMSCDNNWYRCRILSILNTQEVKVYVVDFGNFETISRKHLYYLKDSFILVPAQAFKAQLALVQPANKAESWSYDSADRFGILCNKPYLMAKVNSVEQNDVASLFLCEEGDVSINDTLVNEGLADRLCTRSLSSDKSDESMDDSSALSDNPSPINEFLRNSKLKYGIKSSSSKQNHLNNGNQISNSRTKTNPINKLKELKLSKDRRSVRRIILGDGYQIHILIVEEAVFVSGDDLCDILWKGKDVEVLTSRLEFKEVSVPSLTVSKSKYPDLFSQCERYGVGGFSGIDDNYSVILYPLKYSLKVLNVFGHPSWKVRDTLTQEIRQFDPHALVWKKSETNGEHYEEESINESEQGSLHRLCVYDLKTKREGLECKKLKVIACHKKEPDENFASKIKDIESMKNCISQRIKEIEEICLQYKCDL